MLVDGGWCRGELRSWSRRDDAWVADVQYRPDGEHSSYLGTFAEDEVREDTVDRSPKQGLPMMSASHRNLAAGWRMNITDDDCAQIFGNHPDDPELTALADRPRTAESRTVSARRSMVHSWPCGTPTG